MKTLKNYAIFLFLILFGINQSNAQDYNIAMGTPVVVDSSGNYFLNVPIYIQQTSGTDILDAADFVISYSTIPSGKATYKGINTAGTNFTTGYSLYVGLAFLPEADLSLQGNSPSSGNPGNDISPSTSVPGSFVGTMIWAISDHTAAITLNWDGGNTGTYDDFGAFVNYTTSGGGSGIALPVTLTNFSAAIQQGVATINWTTASEINNDYFTVERSLDGKNFQPLFNKNGAGNSQKMIHYIAFDEHPLPGTSYYRLKQTDFNGESATFQMVSVYNPDLGTFSIESVSPSNFTNDNPILYYKMPTEAAPQLIVRDMLGRIIEDIQVASSGGDNKYQLENTAGWAPGMYIATMYYDGRSSYIKMVKN